MNTYNNKSIQLLKKAVLDYPQLDITNVTITKEIGKRGVFSGIICKRHGELAPYDTHRLSVFTGCKWCNKERKSNERIAIPKKDKPINYTPKRIAKLFDRIKRSFIRFDTKVAKTKVKKLRPLYGVSVGSQAWKDYFQSEAVRKRNSINGSKAKGSGVEGVQSNLIKRSNTYSYVGLYRLLLTDGSTVLKVGFSNPQNGKKPKYRGKGIEVVTEVYTTSKASVITDILSLSMSDSRKMPISLQTVASKRLQSKYMTYETYLDNQSNVEYLSRLIEGLHTFAIEVE